MKQNNPKSKNLQIKYKQLSFEERVKIQTLLIVKTSITIIAKLLCRDKSTISREIKRNTNRHTKKYDANLAENKKNKRKNEACKKERLHNSDTRYLASELIQEYHSPRTVAYILREKYNVKTNYESIYQWIYKERSDLACFLAQKRNKRRKRMLKKQARATKLSNKRDITERPEIVNTRARYGDFESDLIVSSKSKFCILTIQERNSRYCILRLLPNKEASTVANEIVKQLKRFPKDFCKTMTYDNGTENALHQDIDKILGIQSYFCKPYHSWEKGSVENANKLVRRFLPKGTDFALINQHELCIIQEKLNMIPRKSNNFESAMKTILVALLA